MGFIMEDKKNKGGNRKGSGAKPGCGPYGEPTISIRIPLSKVQVIRSWLSNFKKENIGKTLAGHICYTDQEGIPK
jgi:hypothetical protein